MPNIDIFNHSNVSHNNMVNKQQINSGFVRKKEPIY